MYFRGRMHCWWIFDFETDYMYVFDMSEKNYGKEIRMKENSEMNEKIDR
jgi:hypothetical protein